MKNVYALGAYQVKSRDFELQVLYQNDETGNAINYIPEGKINDQILLQVLHLDNLNALLEPNPDGKFDFIEGITITPSNGRIFFPVLEPFGSHLRKKSVMMLSLTSMFFKSYMIPPRLKPGKLPKKISF
ncbi:hypothetical protein ES705_16167 [subsurface metagenome]